MGRFKKHISNAAKQAAFRMQHPDLTRTLSEESKIKNRIRARLASKQSNSLSRVQRWAIQHPERIKQVKTEWHKRQVQQIPFIAIDGEGITVDGKHLYTLLASSEGHCIENWKTGLSTEKCFQFLHQYVDKGILVGFGLNYDVNMMLKDLTKEELIELWNTKNLQWRGWSINWLKSKMFSLTKDKRRVTLFDTFGYFQASFLKTGLAWKLYEKDDPTYKMLDENKANRSAFTTAERKTIKAYNQKECELLVQLMDKLRAATIEADCMPKSWHGAATIAKRLAQTHKLDTYIDRPERMHQIFLRAYFGGRFQICQQGEFPIAYSHDLSSAYPAALRTLPTSKGRWIRTKDYRPDKQWAVYKVQWKTSAKEYLNPFPFRYKAAIYYPNKGIGWYYKPEIDAALQHYPKAITILDGYYFIPESDVKPFAFIDEIYQKRIEYKKAGNDAQLALKLGMNSLYGITAQSIGWKGATPKYQNYFWAGYTTSICRANVLHLANRNKSSVIAFATDGVFATKKLTDDIPGLGGWETDEIQDMFMLQSGVYCFGLEPEDQSQPFYKKSRGFRAASINYDELRKEWRTNGNLGCYKYKETRFIGLGSALPSLKEWCKWKDCEREIDFTISEQVQLLPESILRILPEQPKATLSEPYAPHLSWEEKDKATGETHDD